MKKIAIIAGGAFGKAVPGELEKRNFEPVLFEAGVEKLSDFIFKSGALAAVVSPNFKLLSENKSAPQIIKDCKIPSVVAAYKQDMDTSSAYDCICAGAFGAVEIDQFSGVGFDELADKLSLACVSRASMQKPEKPAAENIVPMAAIGASTGGPGAIAEILSDLPADFPGACVIVQHMDSEFSGNLAGWLSRRSKLPVEIAAEGDFPKAGRVYVSRADSRTKATGAVAYFARLWTFFSKALHHRRQKAAPLCLPEWATTVRRDCWRSNARGGRQSHKTRRQARFTACLKTPCEWGLRRKFCLPTKWGAASILLLEALLIKIAARLSE